jgi:nucleoside 2-deoxyribosyltransferase
MIRVYVAGPYSADNVIDVLRNIGRGQQACAEIFRLGFAPFCPWHDKSFVTDQPEEHLTVEQFYRYSMSWLEVSDCLYVLSGWRKSKGTVAEVDRAMELGKPVFFDLQSLFDWSIEQ